MTARRALVGVASYPVVVLVLGLAAGLHKNARCIDGLGALGFGSVEVSTVTPQAQPGNPKPRMFRLPQANALINRLGFNNAGLEAFAANLARLPHQPNSVLIRSIFGRYTASPSRPGDASVSRLQPVDELLREYAAR